MKWSNWVHDTDDDLREIFERSIKQCGKVQIVTVLHTVNTKGDVRYISAFVPVIKYEEYYDEKNNVQRRPKGAEIVCIAREARMYGGGMDMGFELAYDIFMNVYHGDKDRPYQTYLAHSWL